MLRRRQVVVEGEMNYFSESTQEKVERLLQTFENSTYVEEKFYTESWLRDWTDFLLTSSDILGLNITNYQQWRKELKSVSGGD